MLGQGDISAWPGEKNRKVFLSLGKMAEECCELAGICVRIMIQGIDECEPETKVPNRLALRKEMSDVIATLQFGRIQTGVQPDEERTARKVNGYYRWFKMLDDIEAAEAEGRAFDDFKGWYNSAMEEANAAGYAGQDAASVIKDLAERVTELETRLAST